MRMALFMASGVVAWALHLAVAYGWTGFACARGFTASVPWVVAAATLAGAAACIAVAAAGFRLARRDSDAQFPCWLAGALALFALLGIVWEGVAIFGVPACVSR